MTLPGQFRVGVAYDHDGCSCQGAEGCTRPVYGRVAGEVDSFGVEWIHYCKIHWLAAKCQPVEPNIWNCAWCRNTDVEVFPTRDTDEGSHGPVYLVCKCCRDKQTKRDAEECGMYCDNDEDYDDGMEMEQFEMDEEEPMTGEDLRQQAITVLTDAVESIDRFIESNSKPRVFIRKP